MLVPSVFSKRKAAYVKQSDEALRQHLHFRLNVLACLLLQLVTKLYGGEDVRDLQEVL